MLSWVVGGIEIGDIQVNATVRNPSEVDVVETSTTHRKGRVLCRVA